MEKPISGPSAHCSNGSQKKYNFSICITYCHFISNTFNQKPIERLGYERYNLVYVCNYIDNRLNQSNPGELDLISIFILGIITVVFITIILALFNIEFRQKYNPTLKNGLL